MALIDKLKKTMENFTEIAKGEIGKFMNKSVMEATMAATAMVSAANGTMKDSELQALHLCLSQNEALKAYDPVVLQKTFDSHFKEFTGTMKFAATAKVMGKLEKVEKSSEAAYVLVGVCCEIANADGDFDDKEKACVKQICSTLEVDPTKLGLVLF